MQVYVSRLRKALGDGGRARHHAPAATAARARRASSTPTGSSGSLAEGRAALAAGDADRRRAIAARTRSRCGAGRRWPTWRTSRSRRREIARLEELRLAALEERVEADLALGRHAELVGELEALVAEHPRASACARSSCSRSTAAAARPTRSQVYQDARSALVEELGLEPGEELRELERAMLAQDPALDRAARRPSPVAGGAAPPAAPTGAPAGERPRRRLAGATALAERLDPESLHALLDARRRCAR